MTDYTIYRLFNFETGHYIGGEFKHIRDFFDYHIEHTFPPNVSGKYRMLKFLDPRIIFLCGEPYFADNYHTSHSGRFGDHYAIKDAYGASYLEPQDLYHLAYDTKLMYHFNMGWFYNYEWSDPMLFKPKRNENKLKREYWSWVYRGMRTSNEIRQNDGHVNEYGAEIVRGSRRGYNLPNSRDDHRNSNWGTRKSWKHNSKRPHQWKNK